MTKYYRLDENNNPVECDRATWELDLGTVIETTTVGRYTISTAFKGIDFPLLFETAIFDDWNKEETRIYGKWSTWEEAEEGHQKAVEYVGSELVPF